jgi:tetrahydrodipicolinate N-succinyltransferase
MADLKLRYETATAGGNLSYEEGMVLFDEVRLALESGEIRTAEKINGQWVVNNWVKQAILFGFKIGVLQEVK